MEITATIAGRLESLRDAESSEVDFCHWIEVRGDLLTDEDLFAIRLRFPLATLLYSLPVKEEAGRQAQIRKAAEVCDLIALDAERDLSPALLESISPERRVIAWRGTVHSAAELEAYFGTHSRTPARLYRYEVECAGIEDGLIPLQFLRSIGRNDVTAYAVGESGNWTHILASRLGAPVIFGVIGSSRNGGGSASTVSELISDYGFPAMEPICETFAILGHPVSGSLSPRLHNAAYRAAGAGRLFLSFPAADFRAFWERFVASGVMEALGFPIMGLTIASPHKEAALEVAEEVDPLCRSCQASNLLVRKGGYWRASTTDPDGIFQNSTLGRRHSSGTKVAVIGCGGSGRIAAAALSQSGAEVVLVNRGQDRGQWASSLLGLPFVNLEAFSARGYGAIVNATPVGRKGERLPIDLSQLAPGATVIDLVYSRSGPTPLVLRAAALGHRTVEGRQVLLAQTRRQYYLMTGETMSTELGRRVLGLPVSGEDAFHDFEEDHAYASV